ncbi:MAG: hypothetical protein Q9M24_01440 [Mariprofundaceae bacterium]|nr:hypothetical protein [Mariprofundaceae bacterium]
MNDYLISFMLYAIPANLIAVPIMLFGRGKIQWNVFEYPFIYIPWFAFIALTVVIFGGLDHVPELSATKMFLLVFQSLGSGVMGGLIILPRLVIKNQKLHPVGITSISAFVVALLYVKFRVILFIVVASMSSSAS